MKESEKYSVNEEFSSPTANEPEALYGVSSKASRMPLHQMLTHGMTLEESERRITEKICNFYGYKV